MKIAVLLGLGALAALACAGQASAYSFSPKSSAISGEGGVSFVEGASRKTCTATFSGSTSSAGVLTISKISFQFCTTPGPSALPWTMKATSATKATIQGMDYTKLFGGVCGPGSLPVTVSPSHAAGFAFDAILAGKCRLEGAFTTKQFLQIVK